MHSVKKILVLGMLTAVSALASAQDNAPELKVIAPGQGVVVTKISNSGHWGVSEKGSVTDGSIAPSGGVLVNLDTWQQTDISDSSGLSGVSDVTDDGTIVVGECRRKPAYWSASTRKWTLLPVPAGKGGGRLNAVTPDGRFAVGYVVDAEDEFKASGVAYNLTTNSLLDLPNVPVLDMTNEDQHQNCFYDISPNGRYILGQLSQSYLMPVALCCYVYDTTAHTYKMIGFTENHKGRWTPDIQYTHFIDRPAMSPDGQWVAGFAYMVEPVAGSDWPREYYAAYKYKIADNSLEIYHKTDEADIAAYNITSDGTVIAATPAENPYATCMVRYGNYYLRMEEIFRQAYGIDYTAKTGFPNTGRCLSVSGDGLVMSFMTAPADGYVLKLKEPLAEAAARVNLLANYTPSPAEGALLSQLKTITLTFDREVETNGVPKVTFTGGGVSYTPLASGGIDVNGKKVTLTFRTRTLTQGTEYTLNIPAGQFRIKGDAKITCPEIKIKYTGRASTPVALKEAYPADGASVSHIDLTTNPVLLTFDADLVLADGASAQLFRKGETEPFCQLNVAVNGRQLLAYPVARQNLFSGTDYVLSFPSGVVTDLSGGCPNEAFVLNYHGSYVRQYTADDKYLMNDPCTDYDGFMFYEGDHRAPAGTPAAWGFTADVSPWLIVRSANETSDMAMAAHSMYSDGGKADDWMVTAQIFIPDADCYLAFDAQSYLKSAKDRLKVYAWHSRSVYNTLNADIVAKIRTEGDLVFDQQLSPGESEEGLEGDWTNYVVRLDKYAGKELYLAFVNDNTAQSAVFVDNVQVVHDLSYLTTFEHASRVVAQDCHTIRGNLSFISEIDTYKSLSLTLKDGNGTVVDNIAETGNWAKGDLYRFEFATPLPLAHGAVNPYSVEITLDGRTSVLNGQIKNLVFEPAKRVVLEEYAGSDCSNCPQGIVAIENIQRLYPGQLIPIQVRTYQGDLLGTGVTNYSNFLGMSQVGAPSARLNRGDILFPMINIDGDYRFSGAGIPNELTGRDEECWLDRFRTEIATPAEAEINFASAYDKATGTVNIACTVRNALDLTDANINLFGVLVENGLETYQQNGFTTIDDPDLGQWGKGGIYADPYAYPVVVNDVARATFGTTYNGTGGLIPATIQSGKEYKANIAIKVPDTVNDLSKCDVVVMLIDGAHQNVLNANSAAVGADTFSSGTEITVSGTTPAISAHEGTVTVTGAVSATAYDVAGHAIASGSGNVITLNMGDFSGVAIVRAVASDGTVTTAKIII